MKRVALHCNLPRIGYVKGLSILIIILGSLPVPSAGLHQWGGQTQVDLAADEHGLWALWGYNGHSYKLRVRMIDVYRGILTHAWHLNTGTT